MRVRVNVHVLACDCTHTFCPSMHSLCILYDIANDDKDGMSCAAPHSRIVHATTLALRVIAWPEDAWEHACGKVRRQGVKMRVVFELLEGSAHAIDAMSSRERAKKCPNADRGRWNTSRRQLQSTSTCSHNLALQLRTCTRRTFSCLSEHQWAT